MFVAIRRMIMAIKMVLLIWPLLIGFWFANTSNCTMGRGFYYRGVGGCFLGFFGRPLPAEYLIALKSSMVYRASCVKGLHPARRSLLRIVSFGSFSFSAISEIVMPSILFIIDILRCFLKNVHRLGHFIYSCVVVLIKKIKICSFLMTFYIDKMFFLMDNKSISNRASAL